MANTPEAALPDWRDRITADSQILVGKPVIRGTRIAVESVIDLLARGWSVEDVLRENSRLKPEDVRACLAFAREVLSRVKPVQSSSRAPEIEIPEGVFLRLAEYGRGIPDPVNPDDAEL